MADDDFLILTDDLKLGDGNHKIVYAHPNDKRICVKILFKTPDTDFEREMKYRAALKNKVDRMSLITKYFGEVRTNKGRGYLFERVIDFDGTNSKTLLEEIQNCVDVDGLTKLLLEFKRDFISEKFVAAGMDPDNFLVQRISPTECKIRIIDNIGTSAKFPVLYYFDFLMAKRAKKYWRRFVEEISRDYPNIISGEKAKILLED